MTKKSEKGGSEPAPVTPAPPVMENLFAPELYADAAAFFSHKNGMVSVTFTSIRFDNSTTPAVAKHVVIGRLVMPIVGAQGLSIGLYDYLKANGMAPTEPRAN